MGENTLADHFFEEAKEIVLDNHFTDRLEDFPDKLYKM